MDRPAKDHHVADPLSDRKAGALLVAFLAAVIVVLALATVPPIPIESASTHEPMGNSQPSQTPGEPSN